MYYIMCGYSMFLYEIMKLVISTYLGKYLNESVNIKSLIVNVVLFAF